MFCRPPPLRSFLGTRNEVVKIKHYNRKKTDKRETSWSFHYKRCPGVELGTILPGTNPARRSAGKSGFLPIPRGQAGKSRSSACLTGSGREIGAPCHSHGVMPGNEAPLPVPRFLLQILHRPRLTELGILFHTRNSCKFMHALQIDSSYEMY